MKLEDYPSKQLIVKCPMQECHYSTDIDLDRGWVPSTAITVLRSRLYQHLRTHHFSLSIREMSKMADSVKAIE